ncbi:MAG: hypothetical protein ACT4QF_04705 [Sporichthyaceae bacterium]
MTSQIPRDAEQSDGCCWCCGQAKPDNQLHRLGARPEAAVCRDCIPELHRRARDGGELSAIARKLGAAGDSVRGFVVAADLHRRPVIGPVLLWVNRRSRF